MLLTECSFVVVDCETTGFSPDRGDRIIELTMITLDRDLTVDQNWTMRLNPDRDTGPTRIHGIRSDDVRAAPRFGDVVREVTARLAGRVMVAHNASFDERFLTAELGYAGVKAPALATLDTLELARHLGLGVRGKYRLSDCCAAAGVTLVHAHSAGGDAAACAALFAHYLPLLADGRDSSLERWTAHRPLTANDWETRLGCQPKLVPGIPPAPSESQAPRGAPISVAGDFDDTLQRRLASASSARVREPVGNQETDTLPNSQGRVPQATESTGLAAIDSDGGRVPPAPSDFHHRRFPWWILWGLFSLGLLAWFGFGYGARRERSPGLRRSAWCYALMAIATLVCAGIAGGDPRDHVANTLGMVLLVAMWFGSVGHALVYAYGPHRRRQLQTI